MKKISYILLILMMVIVLFPFLYALSASFFSASEFLTYPAKLFPSKLSFSNFIKVLNHKYFTRYIINSLYTGLLGTFLRLAISFSAAFAFTHYRFKYREALFSFLVLTLFIPSDLLLVENYITIQRLHLLDTYIGIISTGLFGASQIFILRQFMKTIPQDIHESALLDSASDYKYILLILLPLSKAMLVTLALQSFVNIFNSYLWPLLVTNTPKMRTIQVGITMLGFSESLNYGPTIAAIILLFIPFALLFVIFKKSIMKALEKGYLYS